MLVKLTQKIIALIIAIGCLMAGTAFAQEYTAAEKEIIAKNYETKYWTTTAAAACIGAYSPKDAPEFGYLRAYGWKIMPHKFRQDNLEANFIVAKNQTSTGETIYVVAFRGSASKGDWHVNLNTDKVAYGGSNMKEFISYAEQTPSKDIYPLVHSGFNEYVNMVLETMVDTDEDGTDENFFAEILQQKNTQLLITGHSLGGAVATLLAERLVSMGLEKERMPVITFGAPAIGNSTFAKEYGDKIRLLRITNNADPVPGSLQTFFGGYKQFGDHYKYKLSRKVSNFQHDIAMYFDYSVCEYYDALDAAELAGWTVSPPMQKLAGNQPLIAVWIGSSEGVDKKGYVPDLKRFMMTEYQTVLPRYVIIETEANLHNNNAYDMEAYYAKAKEIGADYILIAEIDGKTVPNKEKWYVTMNQVIFGKDGKLVMINSGSKLVSPASGNIQATTALIGESFLELKKHLPFVEIENHKLMRDTL